mgnify:CR=1 FL=1
MSTLKSLVKGELCTITIQPTNETPDSVMFLIRIAIVWKFILVLFSQLCIPMMFYVKFNFMYYIVLCIHADRWL